MKIVKFDRRHYLFNRGYPIGLRFESGWDAVPIEKILRDAYGSPYMQYKKQPLWTYRYSNSQGVKSYWIGLLDESMLSYLRIQMVI